MCVEIVEFFCRFEGKWFEVCFEIEDMMIVYFMQIFDGLFFVVVFECGVEYVLGCFVEIVVLLGIYDQKYFVCIGGVYYCVVYGFGVFEQVYQFDEWCFVEEMVCSMQVMVFVIVDLLCG